MRAFAHLINSLFRVLQTGHAYIEQDDLQLVGQVGDVTSFVEHSFAGECEVVNLRHALLGVCNFLRHPGIELEQHVDTLPFDLVQVHLRLTEHRIYLEKLSGYFLETFDFMVDGVHDLQDLIFDSEEAQEVITVDGNSDRRCATDAQDVIFQSLRCLVWLTEDHFGQTRLLLERSPIR